MSAVALAGCTATVSQQLIDDGNLTIAGLQTVAATLAAVGAPAGDIALVNTTLAAIQTGEKDLVAGTNTPAQFAQLAEDEINALSPTILKDMNANSTIITGVVLVENLIPVLLKDAAAQTATSPVMAAYAGIGPRDALQAWINSVPK